MLDVNTLFAAVLTAIFTGAIAFFYTRINRKLDAQSIERQRNRTEQECENRAIREGVQLVLQFILEQEGAHYIREGWCSLANKDSLEKMHQQYHNLGGNGTLSDLMRSVRKLSICDPDTLGNSPDRPA